jgi:hypothetical protein
VRTIEREPATDRTRVAKWGLAVAAAAVLIAIAMFFVTRPPQMGTDEDTFKTVDALYTAVRMKDDAKLTQCETRLHAYREAGKLTKSSADFLDDVIATARGGNWQSATVRLYDFMSAQRREGRSTAVEEKPKRPARK